MRQPLPELDDWHETDDRGGEAPHPDDAHRKAVFLARLPKRRYHRVLDVGCGQGFVTRDLPGDFVLGIDVSEHAIDGARAWENERVRFARTSFFGLDPALIGRFDLIVIMGLLYPRYVGDSLPLCYEIVDRMLGDAGILACVHADAEYEARFPYVVADHHVYRCGNQTLRLEIYAK